MRRLETTEYAQAGFTLVEVIAALTILALVLGIGYRLLGDGMAGVRQAEMQVAALAIAEAQIAALGTEHSLGSGQWSGNRDGFRWTLTVTPRMDRPFDRAQPLAMAAFRIEVEVIDPRGGFVRLSTTRLVGAA